MSSYILPGKRRREVENMLPFESILNIMANMMIWCKTIKITLEIPSNKNFTEYV